MRNEEIAGNRDTTLLKIIAAVCMIIDHAGVRLFDNMTEMRIVGRLAFPIFAWCVVVGACYTRSELKYGLRLLLVGLIAQPCYMLGLHHGWDRISIFGTLLMGYLGILGIRHKWYGSQFWAPLLALAVACLVKMDYGWRGVLFIMLLYLSRKNRGAVAAVMIAFCLYWGGNSKLVTDVFGIPLQGGLFSEDIAQPFLRLQALALLSMPLIVWPRDRRRALPYWFSYAVYPGHLLILWIVQIAMGLTTAQAGLSLLIPWM